LIYTRNPKYREEFYPAECNDEDKSFGLSAPAGKRLPFLDRIEIAFYVQDQPMWLDFTSSKIGYTQVPSEYFDEAFVKRHPQAARESSPSRASAGTRNRSWISSSAGSTWKTRWWGGSLRKRSRCGRPSASRWISRRFNEKFYNGINTEYDGPIPPGLDDIPRWRRPGELPRPRHRDGQELLAKAGYPEGRGLPPLNYYVGQGGTRGADQMLIRQFERVGVKLNPRLVDFSELIELINNKKAQFFGFAWGSTTQTARTTSPCSTARTNPGVNPPPPGRPLQLRPQGVDRLYEQILVMQPARAHRDHGEMRDSSSKTAVHRSHGRTRSPHPAVAQNFRPSETSTTGGKYLDVDDSSGRLRPRFRAVLTAQTRSGNPHVALRHPQTAVQHPVYLGIVLLVMVPCE